MIKHMIKHFIIQYALFVLLCVFTHMQGIGAVLGMYFLGIYWGIVFTLIKNESERS